MCCEMKEEIVIQVDNLWKEYGLPLSHMASNIKHFLSGKYSSTLNRWALRNINVEVKQGETIGVIGPNGAGKSTLLKVLARVTPPTRGHVKVHRKLFPMIELNAGIHPDLTGRENVCVLGAVMGFSRGEIQSKMDDIEAFTELGEWFSRPVRMYSSGMLARLGFGTAVHMDADILLIDEVLAVGDLTFQFKCHQTMARLRDEGKTILFVSHNLNAVRNLCNRVILLHQGSISSHGDAESVISSYRDDASECAKYLVESLDLATDICRIVNIQFIKQDGTAGNSFEVGEGMILRVHYCANQVIHEPAVVITFHNMMDVNTVAVGFNTWEDGIRKHDFSGNGSFDLRISALNLMPSTYFVNAVFHTAERYPMIARSRGKYMFQLHSKNKTLGIARLEHRWDLTRNEEVT